MSFDDIKTGSVIYYPFLWQREHERGETEGRKPRETAVGLRMSVGEKDALLLLGITSTAPLKGQAAIEIPEIEKHRAGLDRDIRLWIMLDEYNYDVIGESFYLEPAPPLGQFSHAFFKSVAARLADAVRTQAAKAVPRHDNAP